MAFGPYAVLRWNKSVFVQQRCRISRIPPPPVREGSERGRGQTSYLRDPAVPVVPEDPAGQGGRAVP